MHNGQFVLYVDKHSATNECTNKIIAKICIALVQSFLLFEHQDEPSREIEPKRSWTIIMRVPGVTAAPSRQSIVQVHGPTRARNRKLHGAMKMPNLVAVSSKEHRDYNEGNQTNQRITSQV